MLGILVACECVKLFVKNIKELIHNIKNIHGCELYNELFIDPTPINDKIIINLLSTLWCLNNFLIQKKYIMNKIEDKIAPNSVIIRI